MIRPNTAEPIVFLALDSAGEPVTGLTGGTAVTVKIFNPTNGQVWDWSTSAFSATPSDPTEALAEVSASNAPGYYSVTWPGAAAGLYVAEVTPPEGLTASDEPVADDLRVREDAAPGDQMALTSGERTTLSGVVWATAETGAAGTMGYAQTLMRKWITNRNSVDTTSSGRMRLFDDDAETVILTWTLRDRDGNAITAPAGSPAQRGEAT
jgi:hypothetical protein